LYKTVEPGCYVYAINPTQLGWTGSAFVELINP